MRETDLWNIIFTLLGVLSKFKSAHIKNKNALMFTSNKIMIAKARGYNVESFDIKIKTSNYITLLSPLDHKVPEQFREDLRV